MQERMTKEEYENFQYRVELFKKGLDELSVKQGVVLLTQALLTPDGRIASRLVFGDKQSVERSQASQEMNRHQRRAAGIEKNEQAIIMPE